MKLTVLDTKLAIHRFPANTPLETLGPEPTAFCSITRTSDELSVICAEDTAFQAKPQNSLQGFRAIQVIGPLDFSLTGVLSKLIQPLAEAHISILAIATFDTDYILVKTADLTKAKVILSKENEFIQV